MFHGTMTLANDTALLLQVTGANRSVTRGVASRGKIRMSGNAGIRGANDPSEAGMLSATYEDLEAFAVSGDRDIEGDLSVSNPDAHVTLAGSIRIGGESAWDDGIADPIHIGVGDVATAEVKWTGNAGGTVLGPIISDGSAEFRRTDNSHLTIDRSGGTDIPPGFVAPSKLVPDVNTYMEF